MSSKKFLTIQEVAANYGKRVKYVWEDEDGVFFPREGIVNGNLISMMEKHTISEVQLKK